MIEKFISEDSVRKLRKQSLLESPDTPSKRDELQFLREITGKKGEFSLEETKQTVEYEEKPLKRSLFSDASQEVDDLSVGSVVVADKENVPNKTRAENKLGREFSCEIPTPSVPQLGARLSNAIINSPSLPPASEEKREIEPIYYDGIGNEDISDTAISRNDSFRGATQKTKALSSKTLSQKVRSRALFFLVKSSFSRESAQQSLHKSQSFVSQLSRSSSYQLHFGNDDDGNIVPDEDILADWDDESEES